MLVSVVLPSSDARPEVALAAKVSAKSLQSESQDTGYPVPKFKLPSAPSTDMRASVLVPFHTEAALSLVARVMTAAFPTAKRVAERKRTLEKTTIFTLT